MNYIYDLAEELVSKYKTRDPFELCDYLGITYYYTDLGKLQGVFGIVCNTPVIFVSDKIDRRAQILVCAHELGHALLHTEIAKDQYLREFEVFNMNTKVEYQANVFAAHLLFDEDELDELFHEGRDIYSVSQMLGINVNLLNLKLALMKEAGYNYAPVWDPKISFD